MRSLFLCAVLVFVVQVSNKATAGSREISCNGPQCNQACINVGWKGGYCKGGQCWCWKNQESGGRIESPLNGLTPSRAGENSCSDGDCNQSCIALGFKGGFCWLGACWCTLLEQSGNRFEKVLTEWKNNRIGQTSCDNGQCNQQCIQVGWDGGYCSNGQCWCWKYQQSGDRNEKPALTELVSAARAIRKSSWMLFHEIPLSYRDTAEQFVASCTDENTCSDACKAQGAVQGYCLKHLCWCSMTNETTYTTGRIMRPILELQSNVSDAVNTSDTCDPSKCRRQCDTKQKTGGSACYHGYCWCKESKTTQ